MNSEIFEHLKFILIDSINDDIQGIYELNSAVKKHYSELESQNGIWRVYYYKVFLGFFDESNIRDKQVSIRLSQNLV